MKSISIHGSARTAFGKKETNKLRKQDLVPCVLYGGKEVIHFSATEKEMNSLFYTHHAYLVDIELEGKTYHAALQDSQFHPVSDKLIHVDFKEIFEDKPVSITVPLAFMGNAIGVRDGGKLRQRRRNLHISGLPKNLPDHLEIDIANLEIGQAINVSDLHFDNIDILDPHYVQIVAVISARAALKGMEEAAPAAAAPVEGAEGAVAPAEGEQKEAPKETK